MKLTLLFLFAITTPFFIFLSEVLYGGTKPADLKTGLAESTVYKNISEFLINTEPVAEQDATSAEISTLIYNRFTPQYIQVKTEKLIDDSHAWITKDGPAPILSFNDIKKDLITAHPEFQSQIEQAAFASEQDSQKDFNAEESLNEFAGDPTVQGELDSLTVLAQNDFSVPVGEYFQGIKTFYGIMQILHPIIAIILLGIVLLLMKINESWTTRLRWFGATFITAAVLGYGMIVFNAISVKHLVDVTTSNTESFLAAFSPILLQLMHIFMNTYGNIQTLVSATMIAIGIICYIASYVGISKFASPSKQSGEK